MIFLEMRKGLNPCSNGILKYWLMILPLQRIACLNPCSNGILKYFRNTTGMSKSDVS